MPAQLFADLGKMGKNGVKSKKNCNQFFIKFGALLTTERKITEHATTPFHHTKPLTPFQSSFG